MMRPSLAFLNRQVLLCAVLWTLSGCAVRAQTPLAWGPEAKPIRQGLHLEWQRASFRDPESGNTLVVWSDTRQGTRDVYGQLISPDGVQLWQNGGDTIVAFDSRQEDPEPVKVDGGWVVAWIDYRNDTIGDVWAQKIDDNCNRLWGDSGVAVDELPQAGIAEVTVRAVHDGSGGAIIAWEDLRTDAGDIYAQRVTSSGSRAWAASLIVAGVPGGQNEITADADGQGNMLVAWSDGRESGDVDIYAAKVTPTGTAPWGQNGRAVCLAAGAQTGVKLCPDGVGGCYIAWEDARQGACTNIYMQHLNESGVPQWASDGMVVCNADSDQKEVRVATSYNGTTADGCITVWQDQRVNGTVFEIYAQKITPAGAPQWGVNGRKVCGDGVYTREGARLVSDLQGGLVCAWEDTRNNEGILNECDLWAGRVLASGTRSWNDTVGVEVASGRGQQFQPLLRLSGSDGVMAVFADTRRGSQTLRYMKLSLTNGSPLLNPDSCEIVYGLDGNAELPRAVAMSGNRAGIVWKDSRYVAAGAGIFYQIVDTAGHIVKPLNGDTLAPDNEGYSQYLQDKPRVCPDGQNGFFVVWEDSRNGINFARLSRVNEAGNVVCSGAGNLVYQYGYGQTYAYVAPDGVGGCYVAWSGYDLDWRLDAYVMRLDANCEASWDEAVRLTSTTTDDQMAGIATLPGGCCVVVWTVGHDTLSTIAAAKICGTSSGTVEWMEDICNAPDRQEDPVVIADGQGGAYFAWDDGRTPAQELDVYAQRVNAQGNPLWATNGVLVVSRPHNQQKPQAVRDTRGNLYLVWEDYRDNNLDLYAQKITSAGTLLWPTDGKAICTHEGDQDRLAILTELDNGLYVAWTDAGRSMYYDVYGTHLDSNGVEVVANGYWVPHDGGVICNRYDDQISPTVAADGVQGMFCAFEDERASGKEPLKNIWANWVNDRTVSIRMLPNRSLPAEFTLAQNFPNPFNPVTQIVFAVPRNERVELAVFNNLGQRVTTLVDRVLSAGEYEVRVDAARLASGTYFYRLKAGEFTSVKKMTLLR
jgi:hypothetical protein